MHIRIGLENNIEGRSLAWALDFPGCFAYGQDESEACIQLPRALLIFEQWINNHTTQPWFALNDFDLRVVEKYDAFNIDPSFNLVPPGKGYEVNAWFLDDWRPLSAEEIERGSKIFRWQRDELLAGLTTLDSELLTKAHPEERWDIIGIAKHIANAELWYLQRMDLTPITHKDLSANHDIRLEQTAKLINKVFPCFVNQTQVKGIDGEFWSYRKILRRILWHQRNHIDHIKKLAFG